MPAPWKPKDDEEEKKPKLGRVYVTYTKENSKTNRFYSGRTSAVIDLNKPWQPQAEAAVRARDANHHIDEDDEPKDPAFGPAQLDKYAVGFAVDYEQRYRDVGYLAIRGREQQLIDYYGAKKAGELGIKTFKGGAKSDTDPGQAAHGEQRPGGRQRERARRDLPRGVGSEVRDAGAVYRQQGSPDTSGRREMKGRAHR